MKIGTWMVVVKSVAFLLLAALLLYPSTTKGLENVWFDPSGGVAFALAALLSVAPVCSLAAVAVAWSCRVGAPNFAQATIWFANGVMFVQTVAVIAPVILILMLPSPI